MSDPAIVVEQLSKTQVWELVALIGVYFVVLGMINLVLAPSITCSRAGSGRTA
jgi:hypothetical protein